MCYTQDCSDGGNGASDVPEALVVLDAPDGLAVLAVLDAPDGLSVLAVLDAPGGYDVIDAPGGYAVLAGFVVLDGHY